MYMKIAEAIINSGHSVTKEIFEICDAIHNCIDCADEAYYCGNNEDVDYYLDAAEEISLELREMLIGMGIDVPLVSIFNDGGHCPFSESEWFDEWEN